MNIAWPFQPGELTERPLVFRKNISRVTYLSLLLFYGIAFLPVSYDLWAFIFTPPLRRVNNYECKEGVKFRPWYNETP